MSRTPRFFVAGLGASSVTLPPEEAHHLLHVLRLCEGSLVELFDGKGGTASAEIQAIDGRNVTLRVLAPLKSRESALSLSVGVAVPKGERMTWTVQKLTELGVYRLIPLLSGRGEVRKAACEGNLTRWRRVALESCKQSGRSRVPEIPSPKTLEEALRAQPGVAFMAHPGAPPFPGTIGPSASVLALVGPEGGWTENELELAAAKDVVLFGLGPRTLRTETAAIAATVLLQSMAGDL